MVLLGGNKDKSDSEACIDPVDHANRVTVVQHGLELAPRERVRPVDVVPAPTVPGRDSYESSAMSPNVLKIYTMPNLMTEENPEQLLCTGVLVRVSKSCSFSHCM